MLSGLVGHGHPTQVIPPYIPADNFGGKFFAQVLDPPGQTAFPRRLRRNSWPGGAHGSAAYPAVPLQEISTIFMPSVGGIKATVVHLTFLGAHNHLPP